MENATILHFPCTSRSPRSTKNAFLTFCYASKFIPPVQHVVKRDIWGRKCTLSSKNWKNCLFVCLANSYIETVIASLTDCWYVWRWAELKLKKWQVLIFCGLFGCLGFVCCVEYVHSVSCPELHWSCSSDWEQVLLPCGLGWVKISKKWLLLSGPIEAHHSYKSSCWN